MTEPGGTPLDRTALAWQRTALATVAASAVFARLTWDRLGPVAVVGLACALTLGGWVLVESRWRYRDRVASHPTRRRGVGLEAAALALGITLIGLTELVALAVVAG